MINPENISDELVGRIELAANLSPKDTWEEIDQKKLIAAAFNFVGAQLVPVVQAFATYRDVPLDRLDIDKQTVLTLAHCEVTTIGDLQGITYEQLMELPGMTTFHANELRDCVRGCIRDFKARQFGPQIEHAER